MSTNQKTEQFWNQNIEESISIHLQIKGGKSFQDQNNSDIETIKECLTYSKCLLVVGEANSGKSTLTKRLTFALCKGHLNDNTKEFIPLLVDCKTHASWTGKLQEHLLATLNNRNVELTYNQLYIFLRENHFLLIFDAYDECANFNQLVADLYSIPKDIPRVITSRKITALSLLTDQNLIELEVGSLNYTETDNLIKRALRATSDINQFKVSLKELSLEEVKNNPLILNLLLYFYSKNKFLTENIYELYSFLTEQLLKVETGMPEGVLVRDVYLELRKDFMADLAFKMLLKNQYFINSNDFDNYLQTWLLSKNLPDSLSTCILIRNNLLLSRFIIIQNGSIYFFHRSIQEFFASQVEINVSHKINTLNNILRSNQHKQYLKFYFSRTQDLKTLKNIRPKIYPFLARFRFPKWQIIENYAACLGVIKSYADTEKEILTTKIRTILNDINERHRRKRFISPHPSNYLYHYSIALGEMRYRAATELYIELIRNPEIKNKYLTHALGSFCFTEMDSDALVSMLKHTTSLDHNNGLRHQVFIHYKAISRYIINKYELHAEDKHLLISILNTYFTNHNQYGVIPDNDLFRFMLERQAESGCFTNSLHHIINDHFEHSKSFEYYELITQFTLDIFENEQELNKKINMVKAISMVHTTNQFTELAIIKGLTDNNTTVIRESIIFLPYSFYNRNLQDQYFKLLYDYYWQIPELRGIILNSLNRVNHPINEIEKKLAIESIRTSTSFYEISAAIYLVTKFNISEAYTFLNDLVGNDKYITKLRCKAAEAIIYLNPSLYLEGFNNELIDEYNTILKNELVNEKLKLIIENVLKYLGNEETIDILRTIDRKLKDDYVIGIYNNKRKNYIYPENYQMNDRNILKHYEINVYVNRINKKIQHVMKTCI